MNVRRFVGKNAREAMAQARAAYGDQAVVLSNRPVPGGVEILAMPSADVPSRPARLMPSNFGALPAPEPALHAAHAAPAAPRTAPVRAVAEPRNLPADAGGMSTLSFQAYVRERQRQDALAAEAAAAAARQPAPVAARAPAQQAPAAAVTPPVPHVPVQLPVPAQQAHAQQAPQQIPVPMPVQPAQPHVPVEPARFARQALQHEQSAVTAGATPIPDLMAEMKEMRAMLSGQLASLSWFDSVRRDPAQTRLLRLMIGSDFSPALARHVIQRLPAGYDEVQAEAWLVDVLARNLRCVEQGTIQQRGGVFALVGPTGVGKTTTTAKIAARFAMEHGAASVGLVTVDSYRMAASDQLRAYGRILGIPVHTACDSASLADLLDLLRGKKLVLVDTVGVGQRDRRLADLFAALPADRIARLLVLNAGAQPEMLEEVVRAYSAGPGTRCVISKLDEAARCGAAIDVAIRHQLTLEGFANGQRVPEDWHAARGRLLVQKALLKPASAAYMPDDSELGLMLTAPPSLASMQGAARA